MHACAGIGAGVLTGADMRRPRRDDTTRRVIRAVIDFSYVALPGQPVLIAAFDHAIELDGHEVNHGGELQLLSRGTTNSSAVLHLHQLIDELADVAHVLEAFEVTGGNGGVSHARTSASGRRPVNERT